MKTLREMTDEVRQVTTANGWRAAETSWGGYVALLHSEIAEILNAFRIRRLAEYTEITGKPDDVGSEFADVLIQFLDMCDAKRLIPFDMDMEVGDISSIYPDGHPKMSFAEWNAWLHRYCARLGDADDSLSYLCLSQFLRALAAFADQYHIDLAEEFDRKIAYNQTRQSQHGGTIGEDGQ